jgi:primary-amine oxidase
LEADYHQYGFYFNFGLDGSVELEVKATGIINVYALAPGEPRDTAHEVEVSPRVVAHHHQHVRGELDTSGAGRG